MITPDKVAYCAQLYTLVTKPALFPYDCQTIVYILNIHFLAIAISKRLASRPIGQCATAIEVLLSDFYKACSFLNPSVDTRY